ncbi:hypothetical protein NLQ98_27625, partial [Escherichia coli]|nr:hypothetical protein [Escherichia coli]
PGAVRHRVFLEISNRISVTANISLEGYQGAPYTRSDQKTTTTPETTDVPRALQVLRCRLTRAH